MHPNNPSPSRSNIPLYFLLSLAVFWCFMGTALVLADQDMRDDGVQAEIISETVEVSEAVEGPQAETPAPVSAVANARVGDETCASCHEKEAQQFAKTLHGRLALDKDRKEDSGCESCHGPGKAHVDADGDPAKILVLKKMPAHEVAEQCMTCHAKDKAHMFWEGSPHQIKDVSCIKCHSVHHPQTPRKLLNKPTQEETCFQCHIEQRKMMQQRSRHPIAEGKVACSDCHNAHGAQGEHLISANSVNDKCYKCHAEKRGPMLWEHGPVREDCMVCHTAHGSVSENLLVAKPPRLCQSCHIQGRHQTVVGAPNSAWVVSGACLNCHTNIHGSNHPSGQLFQR